MQRWRRKVTREQRRRCVGAALSLFAAPARRAAAHTMCSGKANKDLKARAAPELRSACRASRKRGSSSGSSCLINASWEAAYRSRTYLHLEV